MPGKENNAQNNACAEAILACFEALYRTAFRLTGNKAQAEDLVQETYLRAWRSLSRLHGLSSVQPWMFRILRTVFIDQLRRESRRPKLVTDVGKMLAASERLSPPEVSDVKDRRNLDGVFDQEILSAMSELPDEERLARQNRLFWDQKGGAYFTTSGKDPNLLLKTKGDFDGAEPSPNSVSALNLTRLSWFFDNKDWARMAEKTINAFRIQLSRSPSSLPQMLVTVVKP
jgi:RNA polymerase sigma factor (sigma-70 family)